MKHKYRTLVLNADWTPFKIVDWRKAFMQTLALECDCVVNGHADKDCPVCHGVGLIEKAYASEYYDDFIKDGRGKAYPIPAVIVLNTYVHVNARKLVCSRKNLRRRDKDTCQYCGRHLDGHEITVDHVVPRSRWTGTNCYTNFKNTVIACEECNLRKANRTPREAKMPLIREPYVPKRQELVFWKCNVESVPSQWKKYIRSK